MDVTMPDGNVVYGVPEGTTKSQLLAKYQKYSASKIDASPEPGILSRISSAYPETTTEVLQSKTPIEAAGALGANVLKGAYGKIGEAASSVTPDFVKQGLSSGIQGIESGAQNAANAIDQTSTGQTIGDIGLSGVEAAQGFAKDNPRLVRNASNLATLSTAEPSIQTAMSVTAPLRNGLTAIGENAAEQLKRPEGNFPKAQAAPHTIIPADAVKSASQNAYKYSENVGGVLHPDNFTNPILDIIDEAKPKPLPGGKYTSAQMALKNSLDEYSSMRDQPMTLEQFQNFDKDLTAKESAAMDGFKSTNNSRIIGQVQDKIRERLQNLKEGDVIGGKEGFDALTQHAIPLWSTQTKMSELEALISKANGSANPTQAMKTSLNNLIHSPKFNNYPKVAQDAIRSAAQRGNMDDLIGIVGSRLNPIVSDTMAGKAVNMATSKAFRNIRNKMQNAKADKIMSAMTDPVRKSVEKFSALPESPYPMKPEVPVAPGNPYINTKAKVLEKFQPNSKISGLDVGEPEVPEPQGTSSMYYKKGGSVKKHNLTTEFLVRAKR